MRAALASVMLFVLAPAATACSRGPRPSEITKVAVTQTICAPHCRSWGATLYPADAADISDATPQDEIHTHVFHETFAASTEWLPHTAFFTGKSRARVNARATVPFATIVQILQTTQFTELQTRYPVRTADVFGASLHLRYRDGFTFDCQAPDSSQWSDRFAQMSARMDQVVLDTRWTPPLPPRRY